MRKLMLAAAIPLTLASLGVAQEANEPMPKPEPAPVAETVDTQATTDHTQWPVSTERQVLSCDGAAAAWAACQAMQIN